MHFFIQKQYQNAEISNRYRDNSSINEQEKKKIACQNKFIYNNRKKK